MKNSFWVVNQNKSKLKLKKGRVIVEHRYIKKQGEVLKLTAVIPESKYRKPNCRRKVVGIS